MRLLALLYFLPLLGFAQTGPSLEVATDREFYPEAATHHVYLEAKITAPEAPNPGNTTKRHLALVVDCSNSMAGEALRGLREALARALPLLDKEDTLSLVIFGSEVQTLVEAKRVADVEDLSGLLTRLEPAGGAAMYDALNQGAALLRRVSGPKMSSQLLLITEGKPTIGPKQAEDFTKLAHVFAGEQITISAIGVGTSFNEDLLAAIAREGQGQFHYSEKPEGLTALLQAKVAQPGTLVATDLQLKITAVAYIDEMESYGWAPAEIHEDEATIRFPQLYSGHDLSALLSIKVRPQQHSYDVADVEIQWNDASEGKHHSLKKRVGVSVERDNRSVQTSVNAPVIRTLVKAVISQGMQEAIEKIDKGEFKKALRSLNSARSEAQSLNSWLEDADADKTIALLETYIATVKARGMNQLDRKVLRSGLFNQFQTPTAEEKDKH